MTACVEGDFVDFLTSKRVNKAWKIHHWYSMAFGMPRVSQSLGTECAG